MNTAGGGTSSASSTPPGWAGRRAPAGGGAHPRRLLAGALRPAARGRARRGPCRPRLGGLEPRVPPPRLAQPWRLAGDVRGRGGRHRPARQARRAARPRRVLPIGHSAGGHLASLGGGAPRAARRSPRRRAEHPARGRGVAGRRVDLREAARSGLSRSAAESLFGGPPGKMPERYDLASPIERLPLGGAAARSSTATPTTSCRSRSPARYAERAAEARGPVRARRAARLRARRAPRPGERRLADRDAWLERR